METTAKFSEYLFNQAPVIVFSWVVIYFMYRYFTSLLDKREAYFKVEMAEMKLTISQKDEKLDAKDKQILEMYDKMMQGQLKQTEAFNRMSDAIENMKRG